MRTPNLALGAVCAALPILPAPVHAGDDPFADEVIAYDQGANPAPGYTDPATALCSPQRFTGEGVFPSVVSPFSPPFGIDEIVSVGAGGHLIVRFDAPVTDDPVNPYGIDLLIYDKVTKRALPLQIKNRAKFDNAKAQTVQFDVRKSTFSERGGSHLLAVLLDKSKFVCGWLVPMSDLQNVARANRAKFSAIAKNKPDCWYRQAAYNMARGLKY